MYYSAQPRGGRGSSPTHSHYSLTVSRVPAIRCVKMRDESSGRKSKCLDFLVPLYKQRKLGVQLLKTHGALLKVNRVLKNE